MSDEERIEARLRGLRPAGVRAELVERVGESLEGWTVGERVMAAWMGLGAVAAAVMVMAVVWQVAAAPQARVVTADDVMAQQRVMVEYEKMLAGK